MDAIDILALIVIQSAVDVLLKNLEIARHCVQRSAELVTQSSKQLGLDTVCGFRLFARGLFSGKRDFELACALRDPCIQRPIERAHALFAVTLRCDVAQQPAERLTSGVRWDGGNGGLDRQKLAVSDADLDQHLVATPANR